MSSSPEKLPPYVAELLAAEREAPRPSLATQRRVRAQVAATLVATATAAGATAVGASTAQAAAAAGVAVKTGGLALGAKLSVLALSVGVLGTAGVVGYRHHAAVAAKTPVTPAAPHRVRAAGAGIAQPTPMPVAPPALTEEPALPEPTVPAPVAPAAADQRPRRAAPAFPTPPRAAAEPDPDLGGESPLIEGARARLGEGNAAHALALLASHARRFAHGQLEEEREALWVQALVVQGAFTEARSRALHFEQRFPHSIQREMVRTTLRSIAR